MKLYMKEGNVEGLKKKLEEYPEEPMLLFQNEDKALLIHETDGTSVFVDTRQYEILDAVGELGGGFVVCNNIPVTEDGRPIFEERFQNRARLIEKESGFVAIRVLRPLSDDTYVIMTLWENEDAFKNWQQSKAYEHAHKKRGTTEGVDQQKQIFPRPSFVTTYKI